MKIIYANAKYEHHSPEGGQAHMRQFIQNAAGLGHEVYLWHGVEAHPLTRQVPTGKLARLKLFRSADVIYYRVEWRPPVGNKVILPPYRGVIGNPLVVLEFNTVPEYGRVQNVPEHVIEEAIGQFRKLAPGVNLTICVSRAIEQYVQTKLDLKHTLVVPNGSDPDLFRPDVEPVKRIIRKPDRLNIVWIGSAALGWHNFDLLRDTAWKLYDAGEGERYQFHVIGAGMQRMRETPPNMQYQGSEQYALLPHWLTAMDVGLNVYRPGPADYSSPLKIFDYMSSGLTVVSTEQPQAREIFEQLGQTDLLIPHDQPEKLVEVLRGLNGDRERLRRLGEASRKLVVEKYNWRHGVETAMGEIEKLRTTVDRSSR